MCQTAAKIQNTHVCAAYNRSSTYSEYNGGRAVNSVVCDVELENKRSLNRFKAKLLRETLNKQSKKKKGKNSCHKSMLSALTINPKDWTHSLQTSKLVNKTHWYGAGGREGFLFYFIHRLLICCCGGFHCFIRHLQSNFSVGPSDETHTVKEGACGYDFIG